MDKFEKFSIGLVVTTYVLAIVVWCGYNIKEGGKFEWNAAIAIATVIGIICSVIYNGKTLKKSEKNHRENLKYQEKLELFERRIKFVEKIGQYRAEDNRAFGAILWDELHNVAFVIFRNGTGYEQHVVLFPRLYSTPISAAQPNLRDLMGLIEVNKNFFLQKNSLETLALLEDLLYEGKLLFKEETLEPFNIIRKKMEALSELIKDILTFNHEMENDRTQRINDANVLKSGFDQLVKDCISEFRKLAMDEARLF